MSAAWMEGPIAGVPALLQPVAHALVQSLRELRDELALATPEILWAAAGDAAPAGFHVQHAAGSLDRLFTYARGEQLSSAQLAALADEKRVASLAPAAGVVLAAFEATVERAMAQLRATDESTLLEGREVGRARLPSNVLGLLFHAAEHTQRHVGQLTTTLRMARTETTVGRIAR